MRLRRSARADGTSDPARAVLARHTAYVGHPDALVLTYRLDPTAKSSPTPGASPAPATKAQFPAGEVTTYRRGAVYHEVDRAEGVSTESGYNGRAFWISNENGYAVGAFEDAARRMVTANAVDGDNFDNAAAHDRPAQTIDGKPVDVVRVTPPDGIPADLAVDRATGAFVQITYDPEDRYRRNVVRIPDYREIAAGVRVPATYRYGRDTVYKLQSGTVRAVADDELHPPPCRLRAGPLETATRCRLRWVAARVPGAPSSFTRRSMARSAPSCSTRARASCCYTSRTPAAWA